MLIEAYGPMAKPHSITWADGSQTLFADDAEGRHVSDVTSNAKLCRLVVEIPERYRLMLDGDDEALPALPMAAAPQPDPDLTIFDDPDLIIPRDAPAPAPQEPPAPEPEEPSAVTDQGESLDDLRAEYARVLGRKPHPRAAAVLMTASINEAKAKGQG